MEQNNSNQQDIATKKMLAKRILAGAVAADLLAIIYFCIATYVENQSGETQVPSIIALVYNSMGKIGGTVLFLGLGMLLTIVYVIKMAGIKKQSQG